VHLKIDTGMSRLGLLPGAPLEKLCDALERAPACALSGLMTHFHSADEPGPEGAANPTQVQLDRFAQAREQLRRRGHEPQLLHAANSAALVRFPESRFGLVRPGLALYGLSPSPEAQIAGLRPVLSLRSRIVALRDIAAGESVSYGARFVATRKTRVATVPVGYADGYTRRLSGKASVLVNGKRAPVLGSITMDMCLVDVTDVGAQLGDEVVPLGAQGDERITAEELAAQSDTISWEILCGISKRVPRIYSGERP